MMRMLLLVPAFAGLALAWVPEYDPEYQLKCGGTIIDVGYYAAPCVVDWDLDGLKDLILGQFSSGNIRFYKNEGSNEAPVFNSFSYLYSDGSIITVPSG
ncbi:hypothetical protein JW921_02205 [Candidatus Fermentibacterales bacterium]|nr:hypothetical protein [Candidatus Fermentibacterales bacterium]